MGLQNEPSRAESPQGRRVIVALVTGPAGARIQAWRKQHDLLQAERIPPHLTLCYWAPGVDPGALEAQVRHAFAAPARVWLGGVREFDNDQHTFYVEVTETGGLDTARRRLYDGTHVELPGFSEWTWHVTCVYESLGRDLAPLRSAAEQLTLERPWAIETVAYLESRGERYVPLSTIRLV